MQNTLGYSPVQAGLRFLPLFLASFTVALLTGRLIGKVAMRVLLGVAMAAAAAGLASMAHLTATSTWLVLLPGFILAGIGLGITSTGLASAALSAVEPAHAGMAAGLTNTLRQVGTATGVAVLGALYASRVTIATLHALAGLPEPARPGVAAGAVARGEQPRPADRQRDLPDDRPPSPVRGGGVPAQVPASFQPHLAGPGRGEGDVMELNGWSSPQMLRRHGASARSARARRARARRI